MPAELTHAEIVAALTSRWPEHRVAPSLGRIRALTELLGDPQRVYPVIHLTGTNGKGSTAAMIESLLRADGLRTGRFTSPHVMSVTERITIDGESITDERFDEVWREIEPYVALVDQREIDGVKMTFFEIITAMAYAAFADAPVDVAVIEVGLGGAWDATNVADAGVAVVTPIDLDHTHLLGRTIAEITREKIYRQLHQELPYQSTVETDSWTERKDKSVRIEQTIFVERESQRKIVLGKGGATIKSIGADSRKEIAEIVGVPVHLFLFVKVRENWGDDPDRYREMGLEFPKE